MEAAGGRKSTRDAYFLVGRKIIALQDAPRISVACLALISRYTEPTPETDDAIILDTAFRTVDCPKYDRPSPQPSLHAAGRD